MILETKRKILTRYGILEFSIAPERVGGFKLGEK
jgi:hypothetical protein